MRAVNLLTLDSRSATRLPAFPKPTPGVVAGIVASVLFLGLGVAYLGASGTVRDRQREVSAVSADERALVARVEGARNEQALVEREQRDAALDAALVYRIPWDQLLRDVARVLPAGVSVVSLSAQSPTVAGVIAAAAPAADPAAAPAAAAAATAPSGLVLSGMALTQPTVALVLDRLALLPNLVGVQLQSSTKTVVGKRTARAFVIAAGIRAEGAPR